jgi:hypothetical protein
MEEQSMSVNRTARYGMSGLAATMLVACLAAPVAAQEPTDPNPGNMTVSGGIDFLNAYMFRGIRQDDSGLITWPYADFGLAVYSGDGGLKSVGINVGTWNSLHTGPTGSENTTNGKLWYESDFYATFALGFGGGVSLGTTYTAYTSPNSAFTTVKEFAFKLGADDSAYLGRAALKPYALFAFEFDTEEGRGQADGGLNAGKYLKLGVAPGYAASKASIAFPLKLGLSLGDYYELGGVDSTFGFFSVAGIVTVPLGGTTSLGAWNIHGGVEYQALGETTKAINLDEGSKVIGSFGIGFSY